jgi:hypothetical protein
MTLPPPAAYMFDRKHAESEIRSALVCPIRWAAVFRIEEARAYFHPLERLWFRIVEDNAVDDEATLLGDADFSPLECLLSEESEESLRAMQQNVRTWKDRAHEEYLSQTRRFWALQYASRQVYGKHLPPHGQRLAPASIEAISAKTGISKFYQEIPAEVMLCAFFTGIFFHFDQEVDAIDPDEPVRDQPLWNDLLQSDNCRVVFRSASANPIGASDGLPRDIFVLNSMPQLRSCTPIQSPNIKPI